VLSLTAREGRQLVGGATVKNVQQKAIITAAKPVFDERCDTRIKDKVPLLG